MIRATTPWISRDALCERVVIGTDHSLLAALEPERTEMTRFVGRPADAWIVNSHDEYRYVSLQGVWLPPAGGASG